MRVLLLNRSFGIGGMQRYVSDLRRALEEMGLSRHRETLSHVHLCDAALLPLARLIRLFAPGLRISATLHGLDLLYGARWYQWLLKTSFDSVDQYVCVSEATVTLAREKGIDASKLTVITPGVWEEVLQVTGNRLQDNQKPILLTVGRLVKRKGVAWFTEHVLPELVQRRPKLEYWIVGDGPESRRIEEIVLEKNVEHCVKMFGKVDDETRDECFTAASLFVMPNIEVEHDMEGFGIACIEASSRGIPVIAAALEGLQDSVVDGLTGKHFESGNAPDCIEAIEALIVSPIDAKIVSRETLDRFDWRTVMQQYRSVFVPEPNLGIVSWDYGEGKGGLGRAMQWMADAIGDVRIASPCAKPSFLRCTKFIGGHVLFSLLLPLRLSSWLKRNTITSLMIPVGPGGVFLLRRPKCPVTVVCYHTYSQQSRLVPGEKWKRIFIPLEKRTLQMADRIFCYSEDTQRVLRDYYGIEQRSIISLPQIFDGEAWVNSKFPRKDGGLCVCVARLEKRKGVDVLLDAWASVIAAMPAARLTIIGTGMMQPTIERRIRELGSSIELIDFIDRDTLIDVVQSADIAICPSYLEGFGLAAVEAMAAGTTVIACDTDGLRNLVDHERTGLLVAPGSPDDLSDAIVRLLEDHHLRSTLADNAKGFIAHRFDHQEAQTALHAIL